MRYAVFYVGLVLVCWAILRIGADVQAGLTQ